MQSEIQYSAKEKAKLTGRKTGIANHSASVGVTNKLIPLSLRQKEDEYMFIWS